MSRHTPGPWARIIADGYTVRHPQIYSDTGPVANATWLGDGRIDELNANARLIASAPDLLKQRDELLAAVQYAADVFAEYVALHKAKGAAGAEKAQSNQHHLQVMLEAIANTGGGS